MWNKVYNLTKVFLKDTYQNFKIFNNKTKKIDKKSIFFWMILIIIITISFFSYKIIELLVSVGQPQVFLNLYFIILIILLMFQIVLIATNVLFFSKELEYVLPMPINSLELLLSKLGVFLVMTYITESIFGFIPLITYGLITHISIMYFIVMPLVLILFPVTLVSIIALVTIILMSFSKIVRNKNFYQTIITIMLLVIVVGFEMTTMNQFGKQTIDRNINFEEQSEQASNIYRNLGDNYLIINPAIEILSKPDEIGVLIINFGKFIIYDLSAVILFLFIGKIIYLKNVLSGRTNKTKNNKKVVIKNKVTSPEKAYIKKEFKQLYRNPSFFMQLIFPSILIIISLFIIGSVIIPIFNNFLQSNLEIKKELENLVFNSEKISIVFCVLQVLFSISGVSLTGISREGESAILIKYIPLDLYKQFLCKNIIQVTLNLIISLLILLVIYFLIPKITIIYTLQMFVVSIFVILINSYTMLIVDLKRPILNWDSEYMVIKKNPNKVFQYAFMIIMILIFLYLGKVLKDINTNVAMIMQIGLFALIFLIINFGVKKNYKNLFRNIK